MSESRPHLVFLGAPGSGKGTQSYHLVNQFGYEHLSTGDLLRAEIQKGSELGVKAKQLMDQGQLVPDHLVLELLKKNIDLSAKRYIFDGFPRNGAQAQSLDSEVLSGCDYRAVYFHLPLESLLQRLVNRRVSPDGKHIYNLVTNPPKVAGICDHSGEKLVHRDDDHEDVVMKRMEVFKTEIEPVLEFYKALGILVEIAAERPVEQITNSVIEIINGAN